MFTCMFWITLRQRMRELHQQSLNKEQAGMPLEPVPDASDSRREIKRARAYLRECWEGWSREL